MKLKKTEAENEMPAVGGGAVIADRFRLDASDASAGPAGVGKTSTLIALLCALAAVAMIGGVAALMYLNWEEIAQI